MALHILSSLYNMLTKRMLRGFVCVCIYIYRSACSEIQFNKRDFVFSTYFPVCVFLIWYFWMYANMHLWLVFRKMFYIFFMPSPLSYLPYLCLSLFASLYFFFHSFNLVLHPYCVVLPNICYANASWTVMLCINVEWNANNFSLNPIPRFPFDYSINTWFSLQLYVK